jgi:DNA polymerase-4
MGAQCALGRGPHPADEVDAVLATLVDRVTRRMRAAGRPGRTVVLRLRFGDFTRATRSRSLPKATGDTEPILATARALLAQARPLTDLRGLTLVGVSVGNLDNDGAVQLELPFGRTDGHELDRALDAVRDRFGSSALTRAASIGQSLDPAVPLLPD